MSDLIARSVSGSQYGGSKQKHPNPTRVAEVLRDDPVRVLATELEEPVLRPISAAPPSDIEDFGEWNSRTL